MVDLAKNYKRLHGVLYHNACPLVGVNEIGAHSPVHTKLRNRLNYENLHKLVFCALQFEVAHQTV